MELDIKFDIDNDNNNSLDGNNIDDDNDCCSTIKWNRLSDVCTDENLIDLQNDPDLYIYFCYPLKNNGKPPEPLTHIDDYLLPPSNNVHLPYTLSKWNIIKKVFLNPIKNIDEFELAIKTYNPSWHNSFDILYSYVNFKLNEVEKEEFFNKLLPNIIRLALSLPNLICYNLASLETEKSATVFLTQEQISSLIANAFLCTYPEDLSKNTRQCINFINLFSTNGCDRIKRSCKLEKLKCLVNYLRRVTEQTPIGTVSFERKRLIGQPELMNSQKCIGNFQFNHDECLIEGGYNYSQVDFAHQFIGGGVMGTGCVQEEILFVVCPELIISKMICQKLLDNEAIIITGVEQFNQFNGYAERFKWQSSFNDRQDRDKYGRLFRQILAMDALYFKLSTKMAQYEKVNIDRELIKAMTVFQGERFLIDKLSLPVIATGNWGCGVYNGDVYLKALIQILAASEMERNIKYFTFNDIQLKNDFEQIQSLLKSSNETFTVGKLYRFLLQFADARSKNASLDIVVHLADYILNDSC